MTEGRQIRHRLEYAKLLQALGRFCDRENLEEIALLEFDKGIVLQAINIQSTSKGYIRQSVTHTLSYEQIANLARRKGRLEQSESGEEGESS